MKRLVSLFLGLILLPACINSPGTYYYTLHSVDENKFAQYTPLNTEGEYTHTVGVGPVILPESLIHPGLVSFVGQQEVDVSLFNIWSGRFDRMVTRVMGDNISKMLAVDGVWPFPWDNRARPSRQLRVVVEQLAGYRGGEVVMQAKWTVLSNNGEQVLAIHRGKFVTQTQNSSYSAYVAALNDVVNQFSYAAAKSLLEDK